MKNKLFLILALAFLLSSCGKEAAVDKGMEEISGEYVLSQYCIDAKPQFLPDGVQYPDLKAEIVKKDGRWVFSCVLPIMHGEDSCTYLNVEQPKAWSPLLKQYVIVGELTFAKKAGIDADNAYMYYDMEKNKIGLDIFRPNASDIWKWYNWKKK